MKPRLSRENAQDMGELMQLWVKEMRLGPQLNAQRAMAAWDKVSGVERYTLSKYVRNGVLYVSVSSSVVRSHLLQRLPQLAAAVNAELKSDPLFTPSPRGTAFIKSIVLR